MKAAIEASSALYKRCPLVDTHLSILHQNHILINNLSEQRTKYEIRTANSVGTQGKKVSVRQR